LGVASHSPFLMAANPCGQPSERDHKERTVGIPRAGPYRRRRIVALMWNRSVEWDAEDWRKVAACKHTEPDLFFPVGTTGPAIEQIEAAKRVCRSCEAIEPCLEFALATNQESGIWGGTSEEERRKLRKAWLAARRRAS
jgi:WhiB family redox-sensing transcriptional regulator